MPTEQQKQDNTLHDRPDFLLDDENVKLQLVTKSKNTFSSSEMEYYLTDSRVIATKSDLSSNRIRDISLDQIVSVDEEKDNVLIQYIAGGVFILMGVTMTVLAPNSSTIGIGILSILVGSYSIIYAYRNRATGYVIKTPNPDVSLGLNVTGNSPKTQKFVDSVRKEARRK